MTKTSNVPKSDEELVKEQIKETVAKEEPAVEEKVDMRELAKLIEAQSEELAKLKKQNEMLLEVADSKQLANYYSRNQVKIASVVKLRAINDKVIVGWRTIKDEVDKDPVTGRWYETQVVEVIFEDSSSEQFHLLDFSRKYTYIPAKVLSNTVSSETGATELKVKREDNGREITIDSRYVN